MLSRASEDRFVFGKGATAPRLSNQERRERERVARDLVTLADGTSKTNALRPHLHRVRERKERGGDARSARFAAA